MNVLNLFLSILELWYPLWYLNTFFARNRTELGRRGLVVFGSDVLEKCSNIFYNLEADLYQDTEYQPDGSRIT